MCVFNVVVVIAMRLLPSWLCCGGCDGLIASFWFVVVFLFIFFRFCAFFFPMIFFKVWVAFLLFYHCCSISYTDLFSFIFPDP